MSFNLSPLVERFNRLDIKLRYALFVFVLIALVGLDYTFLIRAQVGELRVIDEQVKKITQDTAQVNAEIQRINQVKSDLDKMRVQLEEFNSKVRFVQDVPVLLEDIARLANESGVGIDRIVPVIKNQVALTSGTEVKYYSLPIVIDARSGYHMFGRFLNQLENSDLMFMLNDLRIEEDKTKLADVLSIRSTLKIILAEKSGEVKK